MDGSWWALSVLLYVAYLSMVTTNPLPLQETRSVGDPEQLLHEQSVEENRNVLIPPGETIQDGDILLRYQRRNAVSNYHLTWTNRIVPINMSLIGNDRQITVVRQAMEEIENKSCVRFVNRTTERDYILIVRKGGCFSQVGRTEAGGVQLLYLADHCYLRGVVMHELMHALGFWHEHSRPDRDLYITILRDNIASGHGSNFDKYGPDTIDVLGAPYDYGSIMHYRNNTFAKNRSLITINATEPLPPGVEMGQRKALSLIDELKLLRLYKCNITGCNDPGTPQNGNKEGNSTDVAAEVTYSCYPSYSLYGSRKRICTDHGYWTGHLPSCLRSDPGAELRVCDFDSGLCPWLLDPSGLWTLRNGPTPSADTGPERDHTLGTDEGSYVYLEASGRQTARAHLFSPIIQLGQNGLMCMMFYYSMYGREMGTLNVNLTSGQSVTGVPLFSLSGDQGRGWQSAIITLPNLTISQQVVIEAVSGSGYRSDIAVDDVVIGPCTSLDNTFTCTFDAGWCELEQELHRDFFDWSLETCNTSTANTGPAFRQLNCTSGSYISIESDGLGEQAQGNTAHLKTPLLQGEGSRCLQFLWHLQGSGNQLTVNLQRLNESEVTVWSRTGASANVWQAAQVDLDVTSFVLYKLVFQGAVGSSNHSGEVPAFPRIAALDSIGIFSGRCPDMDCNFESDFCGWTNMHANNSRKWRRNQGGTPTPNTGPLADHNNSSGHYLFFEASRTSVSDVARLSSGVVSGSLVGHCLQFWYHMWGNGTGELRVLQVTGDAARDFVQLWQRSGPQTNAWRLEQISIASQENFRLIFEVRPRGIPKFMGDIAIDDVTVLAGQCQGFYTDLWQPQSSAEMPVELAVH